jgi:phenylacetate-CoA ligase
MAAYREGMRFRRESAFWDEERKRRWVLDRLRFTLRRAYNETRYYRELFDKVGFDPAEDFSFDDFARLPALEREEIRSARAQLLSSNVSPRMMKKDSTGGSTGAPTEIWLGPEEMGWRESCGEYFMRRIGAAEGARTALFWGHHLDPRASDSLRDRVYAFKTNVRWFDCFRLSPETLEGYHRAFEEYRPACIVAYASALASLAEYLLERGIKPGYPTRCLVTGAEKLMPRHREIIERVFARPLHERNGSRDAGHIGYQVDPRNTHDYEIDWSNVIVEPEGDGPQSHILITKLHADAMPMIRYRIGDIGRFLGSSRPGHPAFAVREIMGRDTDRVWLPDGRWITGLQIPHLMKDYPVREFMLVQRADYTIEMLIVPINDFGEQLSKSIIATVEKNLPALPVSIKVVDEIPRTRANKWRPVVSEAVPG